MKFDRTDSFKRDWRDLTATERELVRRALPGFHDACERFTADPSTSWPSSLRVKDVAGAPGIWEVTFHFAGPDIRATFEWVEIEGRPAVRWRRIGGHAIFRKP